MKSRISENRKVTLTVGQLRRLVKEGVNMECIVSESKEATAVIHAIQDLRTQAYRTIGKLLDDMEDEYMRRDLGKVFRREVENIFIDLEVKAQGW